MKFILGRKQNMTQIFAADGKAVAVTIIKAGPCYVTQIKNDKADGYRAIQIGFDKTKKERLTKPEQGHLKKVKQDLRTLREFRSEKFDPESDAMSWKIGDELKVDIFEQGDKIQVTSISKGKGFQGVVKRHGFSGAPASHGHKDQERMPGSIGATDAGRVFKGKKMGGHMGNEQVTIKNLIITKVDSVKGELYIRGAVPGARNSLVKICTI